MLARFLNCAVIASAALLLSVTAGLAQQAPRVEHSGRGYHMRVCDQQTDAATARCHAEIATDANGHPIQRLLRRANQTTLGAVPYYARDLWSAYYGVSAMPGLPTGSTAAPANTPTVAVVDAYGYRNAVTDLANYRKANKLPPLCATGVVSNCVNFTKLNQSGVAGSYPFNNTGWSQESALDLQMVSALCPYCNIVLVEASSASLSNLAAAEVTASKVPGVVAISNSYGGGEANTSSYAASFSPNNTSTNGYIGKLPSNIAVTVSSGDNGLGVEFPASAPYVISVGGTNLQYSGTAWTQTAWSGAGSGCSTVYPQMAWQTPLPAAGCSGRVVSDVSAVADPNTGVAVTYGAYVYQFGGTSVSAPIIAGIIGQRNQPIGLTPGSGDTVTASYGAAAPVVAAGYGVNLYAQRAALSDVTSGSNGNCTVGYLCNAGTGYDGPTGLGTPKGSLSPF